MSCHLLTTVKAPAMSATEKEDHSMYMLRELVTIKVFWDYAKGEETSNPRFEVPDYIPYVKGEKYLYSSDGNWFSGVEVLDFSWNEKWISFVSSNHDIIILRK